MKLSTTWTDLYGSVRASYDGRAGGYRWLVATPPQWAAALPAALETLDGKGNVELLVHEGLLPLEVAVQDWTPRGVVLVDPQALRSGPEVHLPTRQLEGDGGQPYQDGGTYPAWEAAWTLPHSEVGEHAGASAVSRLGIPVMVVSPKQVVQTLEEWMARTPHGR